MKKLFLFEYFMAVFAGMSIKNEVATIETLTNRLVDLNQAATDIQNRADAEQRDLTDDEREEIDNILVQFKQTERDIERREKLAQNIETLTAGSPRRSAPGNTGGDGQGSNERPRQYRQPRDPNEAARHGFNNFGEFALSVMAASDKSIQNSGQIDPRLIQNAPTTYSSEGVGADGGFAVPPGFNADIKRLVEAEDGLMARCDEMNIAGNSMTFPKDETTPWQNTGGIQAYWEGEADQAAQSKISLESDTSRLKKLLALVPVTDELLGDSTGLDSYLRSKAPEKINFKIDDAIINGNGAGKPLGFMNSGALVTVAKETSQTADTIVFENISKMWARMYAPSRANSIWLINQDIETQLDTMVLAGASSDVPVYLPANGLSAAPYATLKGRPVVPHQGMQTLGDLGDIALVDLSKYRLIKKAEGVETFTSMHLWFDYDVMAFKFRIRLDGAPWHNSPISPKNGSNTLSPFVTLAERA